MPSDDRMEIAASLVMRLIETQFPHWTGLELRPVKNGGWNNRTFHLGDRMSVRLPSAERYVAQVGKEVHWLPRLQPHLPRPIPEPLALGAPGENYPWPWAVYRWIDGETAEPRRIADMQAFAGDIADFLNELRSIDATDGPPAGPHNFHRGGALSVYDGEARNAITLLADEIDVSAITALWERALGSTWQNPPVWLHGDVSEGNMLVKDGALSAVIDFGTCGIGDPACDLVIAWTLLDEPSAKIFRDRIDLDHEVWQRARGWCLWKALIRIVELRDRDPDGADLHRRWINRLLADTD
jgi:aminoglycoside phosphotransferase (APT) family kinase protein